MGQRGLCRCKDKRGYRAKVLIHMFLAKQQGEEVHAKSQPESRDRMRSKLLAAVKRSQKDVLCSGRCGA